MKTSALFLLLLGATASAAGTASPAGKPKSQFNSQIYEQENNTESFTGIVKIVREVDGETQVFFEGKQGFYSLASDSMQSKLVTSQTKKRPINVEVDKDSRRILKAEFKD
jgi:hypothetical protein